MKASFEEKSIWIQLISIVAVLGSYFVIAATMMVKDVTTIIKYVPLFISAVILLVIVQVVGHIVVAIASKPQDRDERDRLIGWRAESNSSWILGAGVFTAISGLAVSVSTVWIAHILMLSMLLSEVTKYVFQLIYYRRGI